MFYQFATLKLVPLCIEDIFGVTPEFTKVKMVNAKGENFRRAVETTCTAAVDWLAGKDVGGEMKVVFEKDKVGYRRHSPDVHCQLNLSALDFIVIIISQHLWCALTLDTGRDVKKKKEEKKRKKKKNSQM